MTIIRRFILFPIVINCLFLSWTLAANTNQGGSSSDNSNSEDWVKVEKDPISIEKEDGKRKVKFFNYNQRRGLWNIRLALSGEQWEVSSQPSSAGDVASLETESIDFGLQMMGSYNLSVLSLGAGINFSRWSLEKDVSALKFGADLHVYFDGLALTPYIVPYAKAGIGRISFTNSNSSDDDSFDTDLVMYYSGGLMFLMDWMQRSAAMDAYFDYGVKGTFLYVEYESFPSLKTAQGETPPDFSAAGMKFGLQMVF